MSSRILTGFICIMVIVFCGCSETQRLAQIDPTVVAELRGDIRPGKKIYEIEEPIVVRYWLSNISDRWIKEEVVDGSKDPEVPFEGYSFDAVAPEQKTQHLELVKAGEPLEGDLAIKPGEKKLFVENVFVAKQPGPYLLSLELRWAKGKRIVFSPIIIGVQAPEEGPQVDTGLLKAIQDLKSSDLEVRVQARKTLMNSGKEAALLLIDLLESEDQELSLEAMNLLVELGENAIESLVRGLSHPNRKVRMRIGEVLAKIAKRSTIALLCIMALEDPDAEVRSMVIETISRLQLHNNVVIPLMILKFEDPDPEIRSQALKIIRSTVKVNLKFSVEGTPQERERQIAEWKEWWLQKDPNGFKQFKQFVQMYAGKL